MNMVPFEFDTNTLRALEINGEVWFVASDVCQSLGLDDTSKAVSRLDDDEKGMNSIPTLIGETT
jgi:prophage antirepressor-like protein